MSQTLLLNGQQVTNDWIKRAVVMPGLEELHIYRAKLSDEGLQPLIDHPSLRTVGVYNTPIHDAALSPLVKLPLLSFVKLYGTQVSRDAADKFVADSGMTVDFRKGALDGIGGQPIEGRCLITTVHRGSPADKAGIQPNDTIVRLGGKEVTSFNKLTELIAPREFGDEVEVEILRPVLDGQTPYQTLERQKSRSAAGKPTPPCKTPDRIATARLTPQPISGQRAVSHWSFQLLLASKEMKYTPAEAAGLTEYCWTNCWPARPGL